MIYMFLSNNPSSGDINSSNLPCYLRGAGEQAHSFGDLGSPAKKQKKKIKEKPPFCLIFKNFSASGGGDSPPRPPL